MLLQDFRFAIRSLRARVGTALFATLTLALGLGAALAIYAVIDAVLLRDLPFPQASRIVQVRELADDSHAMNFAYPNYADLVASVDSLDAAAYYGGGDGPVSSGDTTTRAYSALVGGDFFPHARRRARARSHVREERARQSRGDLARALAGPAARPRRRARPHDQRRRRAGDDRGRNARELRVSRQQRHLDAVSRRSGYVAHRAQLVRDRASARGRRARLRTPRRERARDATSPAIRHADRCGRVRRDAALRSDRRARTQRAVAARGRHRVPCC